MSANLPTVHDDQAETIRLLQQELAETNSDVIALTLELERRLEGMRLLHTITRAIAERQDLSGIFQVVVRSLEDNLPVDFACIALYDWAAKTMTVSAVGARSATLATELALLPSTHASFEGNGLSRCAEGELVYEPYLNALASGLQQRFAAAGLRSLVAAPLGAGQEVSGAILTARRTVDGFSRDEREFLKQLSEHVAVAARQARLREALQSAYEDLRQSQQALLQQERLRALGEMASGVAHDINNAISPITLYVDLLKQDRQLNTQSHSYLCTIELAIDNVAQTVSRLRDFYRQREPHLPVGAIDLNHLIEEVIELTRARWRDVSLQQGIVVELTAELASNLPPIGGVHSDVRDALINLIFNAVDALPTGGRIWIRTRTVRVTGVQHEMVQLEVQDDGTGMDEETRRRCLEPFFTTKGARGTGMGLAMVYGMVQRHSAQLAIQSAPMAGTTVQLSFPPSSAEEPPEAPPTNTPVARPMRLLVIDDDPIVLASLRAALEADGHEVVDVGGGRAGIEVFEAALTSGMPFSAVITDLGMPHVDGSAVAAAVKTASADTPVLLLTGWARQLEDTATVPPHVDRLLSKPPHVQSLREALSEVAARRKEHPRSAGA